MEARRDTSRLDVEDTILRESEPTWKGAEAFIYKARWGGVEAVVKIRVEKKYRHKDLDTRIRKTRTITEARAILAALEAGVPSPSVFYVDPENGIIVLEYIEGEQLYDLIEKWSPHVLRIVEKLGYYTGMLHEHNIAHGDLTTSNVIVQEDTPIIIDYGLAERNTVEEEKAVDLHLFLRSLEASHPEHVEELYAAFLEGYKRARGEEKASRVLEAVKRIRLMGRYVKERKKSVWTI